MNEENKYFEEYYAYVLDKVEPNSKSKKVVFDIIYDMSDRKGIGDIFHEIDGDIQEEIVDTWISKIESTYGA